MTYASYACTVLSMANAVIKPMVDAIVADRLGTTLEEWIAARRDEDGMTWEQVERELTAKTEDAVQVHWTTLRRWTTEGAA